VHLDISSAVPCYCSQRNGAQKLPRTWRDRLREDRQRAVAVGVPAAGPSGARSSPRHSPSQDAPNPPSAEDRTTLSSPRAASSSPPRKSSPELGLPGSPNGSVVSRPHPALSPPPPSSPT
ncbi:hypothetical protein FRC08_011614, partial [Ceratobasidium sp. 394]